MALQAIYIALVFGVIQVCDSDIPSYNLCEVGEPLTSLDGSIFATLGEDCSRIILAPKGYRIMINVTRHTQIAAEQVKMYLYDGSTKFDNDDIATIPNQRQLIDHVVYTSSNAVLIHIDRVASSYTVVDIKYKMFAQLPERCNCLPASHAETTCVLTSKLFARDEDSLERRCKVSCGEGRFMPNRFSPLALDLKCLMGESTGSAQWEALGQFEQFPDKNLITCSRLFPATRLKFGYKFIYDNVSCSDLNTTLFTEKISQFILNTESVAKAGECFKLPNINCTIERPVNIKCTQDERAAQVVLTVRDNVVNSTNETVGSNRYLALYSAYKNKLEINNALTKFIHKNLTVNNSMAHEFRHLYLVNQPTEDCPKNAGFRWGTFGCLKCPLHFYAQEVYTYSHPCQECQNGTRRNIDEDHCVQGPRSYPMPSQKYCKHTCHLGKFYNTNSTLCEWCPYGSYQNSTTTLNPECIPCPPGLTTGFIGARNISECIKLCPAGSYLNYTQCVRCDVGYFMPNASNRFTKCYQCPSSFTTLGQGTVDGCVKKCSVGEYFNMTLQYCTLCPNNTYQDEVNDRNIRSCKKCPLNTTTATTGSTMVSNCLGPCSTGEYIDVGLKQCSPCPRNSYQDEDQHVRFSCKSCGQNRITLNTASKNVSECIYTCSKGEFFNLTRSKCEKCAIDTFQDEIGKGSCKYCQGKKFTLKTGSIDCITPCQFGQFLNISVEQCQKCHPGFYQNVSDYVSDICLPCPIDFYSDMYGQQNCTACPDGTITLTTGADSRSECVETCRPGYYLNKTSQLCGKCLKGYYQDQNDYRFEVCTKCPSANLTTLGSGTSSAEHCVGYCASSPCLNGAQCTNIENDFNCSCPVHLTGKQCERVIDKSISDTMKFSIRFTSLTWNEKLQNPESREFKQLAVMIEINIRKEFQNDPTFRAVKVTGFTQGSVISDAEVTYVAGVVFTTPVDRLTTVIANGTLGNLTVDTNSVSVTNFSCSQPLGMENGRIPDSALTSSETRFYHPLKNARLNHPGPGWAAISLLGGVYLQVDFLEEIQLTGIATQGSSLQGGSWLQAYYFEISLDGKKWSYYVGTSVVYMVFNGNDNENTTVRNTLPYPVRTRYVRMHEYDFEEWISYRVEFYGCPLPKTVSLPTLSPQPTRESTPTSPNRNTTLFSTADVNDDDEGDNAGLIAAVVLGVFVVFIVAAVLLFWFMKRNKASHSMASINAIPLKETK